ncbi:hypothetical protein P43SY_003252 [Pythium insidiosum]|uniref:Uncharacterized protein n=1 Tax=Pythium insidiosum TaxID=114742 RepID=A0AAD5L8P6_PYTIN|nr:hypothetical protein P43SY_003252 [Pythium insidiosum]
MLVQPPPPDSEEKNSPDVLGFLGWWFSQTHQATAERIGQELAETATGLRQSGVAWLRGNRAAFAALPTLRLRLTWMWLLVAVLGGCMELTTTTEALEAMEYVFRRFAPEESRLKSRFHTEMIATFLFDLEWRWALDAAALQPTAEAAADALLNWLRKLVQLLQLEQAAQDATASSTVLTDALEERLQAMLNM